MNRIHASRDEKQGRSKDVEAEPKPDQWQSLAVGAIVPLGLGVAATVASAQSRSVQVAVAAWIATAVVGTASVISAAVVSRRQTKAVHEPCETHRKRVPASSST